MIKTQALSYGEQYAVQEEAQRSKGDGRSSIHYPALFLFVGDKVAPTIGPVLDSCERKWDNAGGVMALHAVSGAAKEGTDGSKSESVAGGKTGCLPYLPETAGSDPRTVRHELYRKFHEDTRYLAEMNKVIRRLSNSIADYGRLYSSFDVIHLSIITRVDDPLNVLLPEITLLARAVLTSPSSPYRQISTL